MANRLAANRNHFVTMERKRGEKRILTANTNAAYKAISQTNSISVTALLLFERALIVIKIGYDEAHFIQPVVKRVCLTFARNSIFEISTGCSKSHSSQTALCSGRS